MRTCKPLAANQRGVVALEFVLVLPFLLLLLFGIIDTSLLLCDKAVITNAAGEAARAGVVVRAQPYTQDQIQSVALSYTANNLVTGGTATTPTVSVNPTGGCATAGSGGALQVTVSYTYIGLVLGSALSSLTGPVTVTAAAVKNCE
ncbi:MAG TPA: TadE/TadG family type IV pilus assembly protein [Trinickia sp.]|jgi:Flp pilus assembly protein TadG|uniref:TadE/TadG family type IV pilus assembly protein n=1 Tax=Trinickia sp. TaxID=2571163 RepID=UPI002BD1F947|nr:TadE/TadG family type IV pilus assembly protein [Trinickia sp.]HTI18951.1 TadE/TadG family type IV pilus assembly protein [Trinickia sp.]